jgi:capsular exopolysaccharide synthesis family protein
MPVTNPLSTTTRQPQTDHLSLQDLMVLCLSRWKWFAVSLLVTIGLAVVYLLVTPAVYTRSTSLLIKEEGKKNDFASEISSFAEMGIFNGNTNVNNELATIQSPDLLAQVIRRLNLDITYQTEGFFHKESLYGQTLPVKVSFKNINDSDFGSFKVSIQKGGKVSLTDLELNDENVGDGPVQVQFDKETKTPLGSLTISRTGYYTDSTAVGMDILIKRTSIPAAITNCQNKLKAALNGDKTTIIDLTYEDVNIQRAEDFLNTLITVYNENWVKDKNRLAEGSSQFIDERLQVIENELGLVDSEISSYKSTHLIPNVEAASQLNMNTANQANVKISDLNNQLAMAKFIRNQVSNTDSKDQLLPANTGLDSPTIEQLINNYNDQMLERNSLVANSSASNPLVADKDKNLAMMRKAILFSLDNEVNTLTTQIRGLRDLEGVSTSRLSSNPKQSKYLLSVERQQKVKEALYLFLLQKREENGLSQAFTAYNTRVITSPTGEMRPTSPARLRILLGAILLGMLIPVIIIYLKENMNTKVRGRKDLEKLTIPFIGEIPLYGKKRQVFLPVKSNTAPEAFKMVVQPQNRNVINEAFRVVRTNVEFMAGTDLTHHVMMVTSLNPGSGKTFLTANIAASFAVKELKVMILDLDMRQASLSKYVNTPKQGVADYLNGKISDWRQTVTKVEGYASLEVIPVGTVPPNPSELLSSPRLQQLIADLRKTYDLVLIDTPPVEIVADTTIISQNTDRTVFVVRAGLMEREMLSLVEVYYQEKKFKNMSLLLNGTTSAGSRYGYHRYGYHYGYGYGNYGGYTKE